MKKTDLFITIICRILFVIFGVMILYLFLLSVFSTSYLSTVNFGIREFTYYRKDNPLFHIFILTIVTLLGVFFLHFNYKFGKFSHNIEAFLRAVPLLTIIFGTMWVLTVKLVPAADQGIILTLADAYSESEKQVFSYMKCCTNQWGIVIIMTLLEKLCGKNNYLFFQFINVIGFALMAIYLGKIAFELTKSRKTAVAVYLSTSLFFPAFLYVSFVYGTIAGLAASVAAFYYFLKYIEKDSISAMIIEAVLITVSVWLKSNYAIALVALVLVGCVDAVRRRRLRSLIGVAMIVAVYLLSSFGKGVIVKQLTGEEMGKGINKLGFIHMGIEENPDVAEGWYSGKSLEYFTDDEEKLSELKKEFGERVNYLLENPDYAMHFFGRKLASEWNNPTFQGFWIYVKNYHENSDSVGKSPVVNQILGIEGKERASKFIASVLNCIQTLILFGTFMYCVYCFNKCSGREDAGKYIFLPVFFIGGFLFHLFWEAKAQYTMPYFVCLIPLAVVGMREFIFDIYDNFIIARKLKSKAVAVIGILLLLIILIQIVPLSINEELFKITYKEELYDISSLWN